VSKKTRIITRSRYSALICWGKENADVWLSLTYFAARPGRLYLARRGKGEDSIQKQPHLASS
jgi:hypothetical protein